MNAQHILLLASTIVLAAGCAAQRGAQAGNPGGTDARVYVFQSDANGFDTRTIFFDDGREVVAFDTQFTQALAQQALDFSTKTTHPLTYAVITHPNPDKFGGIEAFRAAGAKEVVASASTSAALVGVQAYKKAYFVNVAKMFTDETYPTLGKPDMTFEKDMDLKLGSGQTIKLRELSAPGVSSSQTVAVLPNGAGLVVGDLVHYKVPRVARRRHRQWEADTDAGGLASGSG